MQVPAGWHDDGTTLTAPNGVAVVKGFRDLVLGTANWVPSNMPKAPEQGDASSSFQPFSFGVAAWRSGSAPAYFECEALAAVLPTAAPAIPDRYVKALAAIESLANAVAADKAA